MCYTLTLKTYALNPQPQTHVINPYTISPRALYPEPLTLNTKP